LALSARAVAPAADELDRVRPADARRYAAKVAVDEQFGDRALKLLTRLAK
jgi:hypothetical protein